MNESSHELRERIEKLETRSSAAQDFDAWLDEAFTERAKAPLAVMLFVPCALFTAYTDVVLWRWFVMPVFAVSSLTIPTALGLTLSVRALLGLMYTAGRPVPQHSALAGMLVTSIQAGMALGAGAFIRLWVTP
jgi:hypothetical protein